MAHSEANVGVSEPRTGTNAGEFDGGARVLDDEATGSSQIEETLPHLLTNTPSNIARLEDVIEQCEGRQKYLAQTKSPSDGEDIRWYFCKVPLTENERAASVPRTEIVGKGEYFRFSMRDSLALEASFLQREEELLSGWWKEYAECSEGPSGSCIRSDVTLDMQPKLSTSEGNRSIYAFEEERVGVPVKGGLYEVDLVARHCFPVYWHGENRRVLRGHWFARKAGVEWLPLRENVAEQLEYAYRCKIWHRRTFQPSGLFAARIDLQGTAQGLHALFTGEDDTWEAWLGGDTSGFPRVIDLRGNGIKLRRGFSSSGSIKPTQDELRQQKEEEMDDYCSQVPVRHLVFMVHGIGQRLEKANLVDDVGNFRHITASLAEQHLTSYQRDTQRVLFIPCQWRRGLKLGGETAVEKITLDGVRNLRVMLGATVHDVLYYMSPIYCQEIIDSVSNQLNRLYMKFMKRNPGYDGKVSIYGHSLGTVLSFDILCHQECLHPPFPIESMNKGFVEAEESPVLGDQPPQSIFASVMVDTSANRNGETSEELVTLMDGVVSSSKPNVVVHDQSPQSISASDMVDTSANRSGETSEELVALMDGVDSSSKPNVIVHEENPGDISATLNPSPTSDTEEDGRKPDQNSAATFSQDGRDFDANQNVREEIHEGDVDSVADDRSEELTDKDKLIISLAEEVKYLKARIAELELRNNSSPEFHQGDKVGEGTPDTFYSRKLSPDQEDSKKSYTPFVNYTKLDFKVDTFFAVGSPLGVFLALRNIRIGIGRGQDYWQDKRIREEMPSCQQMLNIFHPFDPVAYRLEPLICKEYISRRPVIIPYHKGGKRLHIGFQEFTEDLAARSQSVVSQLKSIRVKMVNVFQSKKSIKEAVEDVQATEERTYGSIMMQRLTGSEDGRIDHVLQDKTFEHAYISAIGAHTNYWRDYDTALFILKHLYRDIPEELNTTEESESASDLNIQRRHTGPFQSEPMDEDLPLTFSDSALLRDFSRKARRALETP